MIVVFKVLLLAGLVAIVRAYVVRARTPRRDRFVVFAMLLGLGVAVVQPSTTSWLAERLGVGRGADLAIYAGFMLVFFLAATQRARLREQEHMISTLVRELALIRAREPSGAHDHSGPPGGAEPS